MATIKSYTDLEQSKKLAEILPLESADMYWLNRHIDLTETKYELFVVDRSNKHIDFFNSYAIAVDNNEIIPAWSLAALLKYLSEIKPQVYTLVLFPSESKWILQFVEYGNVNVCEVSCDNPVDACVDMIEKLHELKMLDYEEK